ncbi:bacteriophage protein [Gallibacterium salpingitidis]|uniref:Bacteriophage protein n=1 Tax=Gallibacterium salpingitidis TaxID=505341 RepID=A0AB36E5C3_9PAST|nr:baseplate J/gp47 family protein [Gallibacterium salpingitidis]OBX10421.1 bacteriophage protein [Gallibacterium salpingitidis]WKT00544.1 baseplate J/gp47 family protein [Gallibacterium salpingitidis]
MSLPDIQFTPEGVILPTEEDILNGLFDIFDTAFSSKLNRNLETPQGQLITSLTAIIADKNNQIAWLANNLDPTFSDGRMQDAIGNIYFLSRKGQINSTVVCEFTGMAGTVIPKGFELVDNNGNSWFLNKEISILSSGTVTGELTAAGVYSAEKNTITTIKSAIVGLDRVTNQEAAIIGIEKENRADFGTRIKNSVAKNSQGMLGSIYSNVSDLTGVLDCYVVDNVKDTPITVGVTNYTLTPHSVYVAVVGGDEAEIAKNIWIYTGNGCDYNGNTTVNVTDDNYQTPKPTYEVKFMRPNPTPIYFRVKVRQGAQLNYESAVKEAIINAFSRETLNKIGSQLYAMTYASDIITALSGSKLLDIDVSLSRDNYADYVELGIDQYPIVSSDSIEVILV